MKRLISFTISVAIMLSSALVFAENPAPDKYLNILEAMNIESTSDVSGGYIMSLEKGLAADMTKEQLDTFLSVAETIVLERRTIKNPFCGTAIVLKTSSGDKPYFINSGVQYGTYGDENYLCYAPKEINDYIDSLYVSFMSNDNKYTKTDFLINSKDCIIYPDAQWAVEDTFYAASKSLLTYDIAQRFGHLASRESFCMMLGNFIAVCGNYANLEDFLKSKNIAYMTNYFDDTQNSDNSINMLHALGIVQGMTSNSFMPNDPVTREQAAVLIKKTADVLNIYGLTTPNKFADKNKISSWAQLAVDYVSSNGIMNGSENYFVPTDYIGTVEAVAAINRLYKLAEPQNIK